MITIRIDQVALKRLERKLTPERLGAALRSALEEALAWLKRAVVERTPVDRGALRAGIYTELHGTTFSDMHGMVAPSVATAEYASVMEWGRRPGSKMPPVTVIAEWLQRKGIEASAFVVARSIGRRGIKGHLMFTKAARAGKGPVTKIINDANHRWAGS